MIYFLCYFCVHVTLNSINTSGSSLAQSGKVKVWLEGRCFKGLNGFNFFEEGIALETLLCSKGNYSLRQENVFASESQVSHIVKRNKRRRIKKEVRTRRVDIVVRCAVPLLKFKITIFCGFTLKRQVNSATKNLKPEICGIGVGEEYSHPVAAMTPPS
eukprot:g1399.t1